jgi:hypothetical protein
MVAPAAAGHLGDEAAADAHLFSDGTLRKVAAIEEPANLQHQCRREHD